MIHGAVDINEVTTITYEVSRTCPTENPNVFIYQVRAWGYDGRGYRFSHDFDVYHAPSLGLPRLMADVFAALDRRMS